MVSNDTIHLLMPEILLVITACWIYLAGAFDSARRGMSWYAFVGLAMTSYALLIDADQAAAMYGPVGFDFFSYSVRCFAVLVGFLFVAMANRSTASGPVPEALGSLLLVLVGLMLVAASGELVLMFLGLELISIPTYILLFLGRKSTESHEATIKYFFLSILSSALLLYGFSFLYGITGSTRLPVIQQQLAGQGGAVAIQVLGPIAFLLIVAGLSFKLAAVPFHFYAPDVYQGTTNLNAGLLAVIPKIAGIVAMVRLFAVTLPAISSGGWQVCLVLAVVTMTLGNVVALWQRNIRRLLAYSSIAHAGYMLIGLAVWLAAGQFASDSNRLAATSQYGLSSSLLYLAVYVAASVGTFAALVYLSRVGQPVDDVQQLAGLGKTHRGAAMAIALFMFSLAGIPPLAGFWGKLGLFTSALSVDIGDVTLCGVSLRGWFVGLAIVGVVNAAVAAAYYLRIVAVMYFQSPDRQLSAEGGAGAAWAMAFCAAAVVAVGVFPGPLVQGTNDAAQAVGISRSVDAAVGQRLADDPLVLSGRPQGEISDVDDRPDGT